MADDLKSLIAVRVRSARKAAGLTQEELASRIAVTPETISNIERARQVPSVETLCALAKNIPLALGSMFDDWVGGTVSTDARAELELKLRFAIADLSDRDLAVAIAQVEALRGRN